MQNSWGNDDETAWKLGACGHRKPGGANLIMAKGYVEEMGSMKEKSGIPGDL